MIKPRHHFSSKQDERMALSFLDDNFEQALNLIESQQATIDALGAKVAMLDGVLMALSGEVRKAGDTDAIASLVIAKLNEKPKRAKT